MSNTPISDLECDVLIIGSGAGGLSTAITCKKAGLSVIVIEKEEYFGGTTAFSGGVLWIPLSPHAKAAGIKDTKEKVIEYLKAETGDYFQLDQVNAFLDEGPKMLEFFEKETDVKFINTLYPDYHSDQKGGVDVGRSILAAPFDTRSLGKNLSRLRPPLQTITFMGMMFNSSNADIKHFFSVTKSIKSFFYVTKRLLGHFKEVLFYKRGIQVTSGNALAARLAKSAFDLDIPIFTNTPAKELIVENGKVVGAIVQGEKLPVIIKASDAVVIATGGFAHDKKRLKKAYPHLRRGGEHFSPVPEGNTGDGIALAENIGGQCDLKLANSAAWMPVSKVPLKAGKFGAFPHLLDRYKPGIIAINKRGERFTNESNSYHDVGVDMIRDCESGSETFSWLICDHPTIKKYGLGYAKPSPVPTSLFVKNGYLKSGATIQELATKIDIDGAELSATIDEYNKHAKIGKDPKFNKGKSAFNRYLADPDHKPNPAIGPILKGPFYALKIMMGDLGTFDGLTTTVAGQILNKQKIIIQGLYAVGNDRASIMGGNYPGAGITLGPAMTFGYITANHIIGNKKPSS